MTCLTVAQALLAKVFGSEGGLNATLDTRIASVLLTRAFKALHKRNIEKALACFSDGIERLNRIKARNPYSSAVLKLLEDGRLAELYCVRAWHHIQNTDSEAAIQDAENALKLDSRLTDGLICRGWAKAGRETQKDLIEAETDFTEAIKSGQSKYISLDYAYIGFADVVWKQSDFERAIQIYSDLIKFAQSWPEGYAKRGFAYYALSMYAPAAEDMEMALSLDNQRVSLLPLLGDCYRKLGDSAKAIAKCEEGMQKEPGNFFSYYICGLARYQVSQNEPSADGKVNLLRLAERNLRTAERLADGENGIPDLYFSLAAVLADLNSPKEAEYWRMRARSVAQAGTLEPTAPVSEFLILWPVVNEALRVAGIPDVNMTLQDAIKLAELQPEDPNSHFAVGVLHLKVAENHTATSQKAPDRREAIRRFSKSIEKDPDFGAAYYFRAQAYCQLEDWQHAGEDINAAIAKNVQAPEVFYLRALLSQKLDPGVDITKELEKVSSLVDEAITQAPGDLSQLYSLRGKLSLQLGKLNDAADNANRSLKLRETNEEAYLVRGEALLLQGRHEEAIQDGDAVSKMNPGESTAYWIMGEAKRLKGDVDTSIKDLSAALSLAGDNPRYHCSLGWAHIQKWEGTGDRRWLTLANDDFTKVIEGAPLAWEGYAGRSWAQLRDSQTGEDKLDGALADSRMGIERNPNSGLLHYIRAWIFFSKRQWDMAQTEFGTAIGLGYEEADAFRGCAEAERLLGRTQAAIENYSKAIETARKGGTKAWQSLWGRGLAHSACRDWTQAVADYKLAAEVAKSVNADRSDLARLQTRLAEAHYELNQDTQMNEAFERAGDLDSKSTELLNTWGGILTYLGRWDEAVQRFTRLIELDPKSSFGYCNRALVAIYKGTPESALEDLSEALKLNDKDPLVWNTRGWARVRMLDYEAAISDCSKAIELSKLTVFSFNHRALSNCRLGRNHEAAEDLNKILAIVLETFTLSAPRRSREHRVTWGATSDDWNAVVEQRATNVMALLGRGISRWIADNLEGADIDLNEAVRLETQNELLSRVRDLIQRELKLRMAEAA